MGGGRTCNLGRVNLSYLMPTFTAIAGLRVNVFEKYSTCSVGFDELPILCFMTSSGSTGDASASLVSQVTI